MELPLDKFKLKAGPNVFNDNEHIILFNNSDRVLRKQLRADELYEYRPQCFQCQCIVKKVQNLFNDLITIEGNQAVRVCKHCINTKNSTCKRCNAIVKMFLEVRKSKIEEYKKRYDKWLLKMKRLLHEILEREDVYPSDIYEYEDLKRTLIELQAAISRSGLRIDYENNEKLNNYISLYKKTLEQILNNKRSPCCGRPRSRLFQFSNFSVLKQRSEMLKTEITELIQDEAPLLEPDATVEIQSENTIKTEEKKVKKRNEAELKIKTEEKKGKKRNEAEPKKKKEIEQKIEKVSNKIKKEKKNGKENEIRKEHDTKKEKEIRKTRKIEKEPKAISVRHEKTVNKQEIQNAQKKKPTEKLSGRENINENEEQESIDKNNFIELYQNVSWKELTAISKPNVEISMKHIDHTCLTNPELLIQGNNIMRVSDIIQEKNPEYIKRNFVFEKIDEGFNDKGIDDKILIKTKIDSTTQHGKHKTDTAGQKDWVIRYRLSDPVFIKKKWTVLPSFKTVQKINIYKTIPISNWFTLSPNQPNLLYDTGEILATVNYKINGKLFYRNGSVALYYHRSCVKGELVDIYEVYNCNADLGRMKWKPQKALAVFDSTGNGVVYDTNGKVRLKYDQFEGWVIDPKIGPPSHWKWNKLNDRPEIEIICHSPSMNPIIWDLVTLEEEALPCNESASKESEENIMREKPLHGPKSNICFDIRMKALKINDYFSLKILSQFEIFLFYRNGRNSYKMNLGVYLDSNIILRTITIDYDKYGSPRLDSDDNDEDWSPKN